MKVGDRVCVNSNIYKYGSHGLAGCFGYVERINLQWTESYGIKIDGKVNDSSKDGLFWLDATWLTIINWDTKTPSNNPTIKNVYFNEPYVIIIWSDKTKTMVKCGENDIYDPEKGMALAVAKKFLGTNKNRSNYYDEFKKWLPEEEEAEPSPIYKEIKNIRHAIIKNLGKKMDLSSVAKVIGRCQNNTFNCSTCKHQFVGIYDIPCYGCKNGFDGDNIGCWKPKEEEETTND